jgi:hypothetical protein
VLAAPFPRPYARVSPQRRQRSPYSQALSSALNGCNWRGLNGLGRPKWAKRKLPTKARGGVGGHPSGVEAALKGQRSFASGVPSPSKSGRHPFAVEAGWVRHESRASGTPSPSESGGNGQPFGVDAG